MSPSIRQFIKSPRNVTGHNPSTGAKTGASAVAKVPLQRYAIGFALASILLALPAQSQTIRDTQDTLISWVDTRKAIAATDAEWMAEREIVSDLISLLESEKTKLESGIEELEDNTDATDKRRSELNDSRGKLLSTTEALNEILPKLETKVRNLIEKLPNPLVEEMSQLIARLPKPDAESRLPMSQRLLTVVGILNQIDKFNTEITVTTEIRSIGESSVEVKTIYFGLAGAYFASSSGDYAGIGSAGSEGWNWKEDAAIARDVSNLINTYEGNREATFVRLPVQTN